MKNLKVFKMLALKIVEGVTTTLSSEGLKHIGKLQNLEKLDVRENYLIFTDQVINEIAKNCKKIAFLNISRKLRFTVLKTDYFFKQIFSLNPISYTTFVLQITTN